MDEIIPGNPVLLVFKEIKKGDIKKIRKESNITPSGGGARDLRFRRGDTFAPIVGRMFPNPTTEEGVVHGPVHWIGENGNVAQADLEFWRPTGARPKEFRISQINKIGRWHIDEEAYEASTHEGLKWFFLLVLDDNGLVWAQILSEELLATQIPLVRDYIRRRIRETPSNQAVLGSLDFITGETYP